MKKILLAGTVLAASLVFAGCTQNNQTPEQKKNSESAPNQQDVNQSSGSAYTIGNGDLVFFWGAGCPHCENVEKFLSDSSGLEEKIKLKKIEVFNDVAGQKIFLEKVKECNLKTAGVPILYKDGKCTQGDAPIIEELKKSL